MSLLSKPAFGVAAEESCLYNTRIMLRRFSQTMDPVPAQSQSDEEILALSVDSPVFFAVLVDRYQEAFLRRAKRIIGEREEAEDIVQEVFTKIYLNAVRFKSVPGASFKSWAYKILHNTAFTSYQKMRKRGDVMIDLDREVYEMLPDASSASHHTKELSDYVASVISRMPSSVGRTLKLYFLEDKSHKEIAGIEHTSIGAIKTRIHRAKKEFKKIGLSLT